MSVRFASIAGLLFVGYGFVGALADSAQKSAVWIALGAVFALYFLVVARVRRPGPRAVRTGDRVSSGREAPAAGAYGVIAAAVSPSVAEPVRRA